VQLAAELAEEWAPFFFRPEGAAEVWGEPLRAGRAERDPALGDLGIVAPTSLAIGADVEQLLEAARPLLALYIGGMGARGQNFYNDLARRYGYEAEATAIQDLYLDGKKREAEAAVPIDLIRSISLIGSREYVRDRVAAYREAGVTTLSVTALGREHADRVRDIETLADLIA
jgi:alkanesulfonate monooxygenase SsuD/methylene tetrahydromethanopterin reductase-like flavin-dependent oxidoreductase (luciferase family)